MSELSGTAQNTDRTDETHTDHWVIIGGDFVLSVKDRDDGEQLARSLNGAVLRYEESPNG